MLPKLGYAILLLSCASPAQAMTVDGTTLGLLWVLPFIGLLLSIAILPVAAPYLSHHHLGKITALWIASFLLPYTVQFGWATAWHTLMAIVLSEYLPFIVLILALYTLAGGILVQGRLPGTPTYNTALLALGTVLASIMGTTGASMLLIRPLLRANQQRQHNVHTVLFFIFLVANIGGGITPLGDPPLFLGYLKGISFFWTVQHMLVPVLLSSAILLIGFYWLDRYYYRQEAVTTATASKTERIKLFGTFNFVLIGAVIVTVLLSGSWQSGRIITVLTIPIAVENIVRDSLLLVFTAISLWLTPKQIRAGNAFSWAPFTEIAVLFSGIFITIAPVIAILHAGQSGSLAFITTAVSTKEGVPLNWAYFWLTGVLSSFLDNAPTYWVFFNLASGDPAVMMGPLEPTLLAISMGAVFMGANSYIGNAPNLMIKAIAEQHKVNMPGFFGYMLWSTGCLIPLFLLHTLLFF